jgi:hypothetical protein
MATARLNTVIERTSEEHYFIYDALEGQQRFAPDSAEWFAWLAKQPSFHFQGKSGHFTALQEHKGHRSYWYAYLKAHKRRHKQYLGITNTLILAKLERVASILHEAALGDLVVDESPTARFSSKPAPADFTVSTLTFRWHDGLLLVKTPMEQHYLNRHQIAELLDYLYTQRVIALKQQ